MLLFLNCGVVHILGVNRRCKRWWSGEYTSGGVHFCYLFMEHGMIYVARNIRYVTQLRKNQIMIQKLTNTLSCSHKIYDNASIGPCNTITEWKHHNRYEKNTGKDMPQKIAPFQISLLLIMQTENTFLLSDFHFFYFLSLSPFCLFSLFFLSR